MENDLYQRSLAADERLTWMTSFNNGASNQTLELDYKGEVAPHTLFLL